LRPSAGQSRFSELHARLQGAPEGVSFTERRELVAAIVQGLRDGQAGNKTLLHLLGLLAKDPKWEIRQDVADALAFVPDEHFAALAGSLVQDDNRYVKAAADRSMERRRRTEQEAQRTSRGMAQVTSGFESFARKHGEAAATDAMRLSDMHLEMVGKEIAHDLLNLLTPMKDHAKLLLGGKAADANVADVATRIIDGLELLHRSIRDIQTYCESVPIERHVEQIADLIRAADELARANAGKDGSELGGVTFSSDVANDVRLPVSRHAIIKAFMNILKNAYEACGAKGGRRRIGVTASYTASSAVIVVKDNGVGLSEDNLKKLKAFMPGRKNQTKKRSTGYGLLIAKRSIEAHGGSLDIQSRLNRGTTVTVTLPLSIQGGDE